MANKTITNEVALNMTSRIIESEIIKTDSPIINEEPTSMETVYDDSANRYRHIKTQVNYNLLLKSGMFWEFHPELTGNWHEDNLIINSDDLK